MSSVFHDRASHFLWLALLKMRGTDPNKHHKAVDVFAPSNVESLCHVESAPKFWGPSWLWIQQVACRVVQCVAFIHCAFVFCFFFQNHLDIWFCLLVCALSGFGWFELLDLDLQAPEGYRFSRFRTWLYKYAFLAAKPGQDDWTRRTGAQEVTLGRRSPLAQFHRDVRSVL